MSLTLYVVRHGQAISNISGVICDDKTAELTITGKMQAMDAGKKIYDFKVKYDAIYSSPYERSKETCMIALETAGMKRRKVEYSQLLIERDYSGMYGQEYTKENIAILQDLDYKLSDMKGIECYSSEKKRVRQFIKNLKEKYPDGNVLVFTHGLFEQALSKTVTGKKPKLLKNGEVRKIEVK